ncbi:MAG TPA: hypothetical protein VJS67_05200 [Pseudonocardiaceae bacterium]|nr:hypothetical protein [Pseudonocardiaceae bacterium]
MTELAVPVSVAVSGELVGIDPADPSNLADLVQASVAGLEDWSSKEVLDQAAQADQVIEDYFARLIDRRRCDPQDDLLRPLIRTADTTGDLDLSCRPCGR